MTHCSTNRSARSWQYYPCTEDKPKIPTFVLSWFISECEIRDPMMQSTPIGRHSVGRCAATQCSSIRNEYGYHYPWILLIGRLIKKTISIKKFLHFFLCSCVLLMTKNTFYREKEVNYTFIFIKLWVWGTNTTLGFCRCFPSDSVESLWQAHILKKKGRVYEYLLRYPC